MLIYYTVTNTLLIYQLDETNQTKQENCYDQVHLEGNLCKLLCINPPFVVHLYPTVNHLIRGFATSNVFTGTWGLMLCVKKHPTRDFNINLFVKFSEHGTRSSPSSKMLHDSSATNSARKKFFNRVPRLSNSVPTINLTQSEETIFFYTTTSLLNSIHQTLVLSIFCVLVSIAFTHPTPCSFLTVSTAAVQTVSISIFLLSCLILLSLYTVKVTSLHSSSHIFYA